MKLVELETLGVRGLPDGIHSTCAPDGAPAPLLVVTGPAGAGTSTFVEAIAFASSRLANAGPVDPALVLRVGGAVAAIRSAWRVDDDERRYGGLPEAVTRAQVNFERGGLASADADPGLLGLMGRYDHSPETSKVVLYPAQRLGDGPAGISDFEAALRLARFSTSASKFAALPRALAARATDAKVWERATTLFDELSPSAKLTGVDGLGQIEFTTRAGLRVPLFRLSASERSAFVFAGTVALMGLERSVLLVDTPEAGLPVGLAAQWMSALRARTPSAQWIVATRDPELVAMAGRAVVDLGRKAP